MGVYSHLYLTLARQDEYTNHPFCVFDVLCTVWGVEFMSACVCGSDSGFVSVYAWLYMCLCRIDLVLVLFCFVCLCVCHLSVCEYIYSVCLDMSNVAPTPLAQVILPYL